MHITIPPSKNDLNISAIQSAIARKKSEIEVAKLKLNDLLAELRGLQAALEIISPKSRAAE